MKRFIRAGLLGLGLCAAAAAQTNGIFADFATSRGAFTVWLDYTSAPRAVASFVGLATGAGSWLDPQGNVWTNRPCYAGSLFHRVVKDTNGFGIAIQGGGLPAFHLGEIREPQGGATNLYLAALTTTNAAGISTSVLVQAVLTTNAPAVATNYVTGTNVIATNAPMVTLATIRTTVVSSNSAGLNITNTSVRQAGYTNAALAERVTTNFSLTTVVITNGSGTNIVTTHALRLEETLSRACILRVQLTNFANAGYTMPEAVANGLLHTSGVISMANSGPNTDGSQFFITTTNIPGWNGNYTVFGHVTTGMNVVTDIAAAAVQGTGERPVQDVRVSNVVIRRVGAAAEAFNIATQGVPVAESGFMRAGTAGTNVELAVELVPDSGTQFRDSANLVSWSSEDWGLHTGAVTVITGSVPRASLGPATYFHAARIRYPLPIAAPSSHRGRTYTFVWNTVPPVTNESHFGASAALPGISYERTSTTVTTNQLLSGGETWSQGAYSADLLSIDSRNYWFYYSLGFTPGLATNRFTCTLVNGFSGASFSFTGTFTVQ